ncbi:hypothetical protein Vretifemale_18028 [Volvox reticuliferus]|uniref:Uncharacterized protein n=2 Tax=Volvox reticuliferus TaxID=1737510 RepID=A0A8J4FU30_9CHLO|nr:hypothetical protein Vretifemale_18028 [Volvox reticuliferus]
MAASTLQRNVRPFSATAKARCVAAVPCRMRVLKLKCCSHAKIPFVQNFDHRHAPAAPASNLPFAAISIAMTAIGLTAQRAFAEEAIAKSSPTISPEDIEILAASSTGSGIDQVVVSLLFGVVVFLLVLVTGGVAYMNISQWLDNRQEKEDRDKAGKEGPSARDAASGTSAVAGEEDDVVPLKRAIRIKKEKGRGFAAPAEFTSRR